MEQQTILTQINLLLKTSKLLISIGLFNLVVLLIRRPPFIFNPRICHIFFYDFFILTLYFALLIFLRLGRTGKTADSFPTDPFY
mgnify:CR=1 FL=1